LTSLRKARRKAASKEIKEVSIVRDIFNKEIRIYTDHGRVQRPLFVVEKGELLLKPHHIRRLKVITYFPNIKFRSYLKDILKE